MHRNSVFNGNIIFDVIKSRKSKRDLSKIFKSDNKPNDNVAGIANAEIMQNKIVHAFILEILNLSIKDAHGPSKTLIPEVTAAQNNKMKNAHEIIFPKGI